MFYSERTHGAGIGLALVRQIVDAHGGSIEIQSERDQGATFIVSFPPRTAGRSRSDRGHRVTCSHSRRHRAAARRRASSLADEHRVRARFADLTQVARARRSRSCGSPRGRQMRAMALRRALGIDAERLQVARVDADQRRTRGRARSRAPPRRRLRPPARGRGPAPHRPARELRGRDRPHEQERHVRADRTRELELQRIEHELFEQQRDLDALRARRRSSGVPPKPSRSHEHADRARAAARVRARDRLHEPPAAARGSRPRSGCAS